jgi:positive regulator of sigma E activity
MEHSNGPVIDMTPDGQFIEPPKPSILTYLLRLAMFGVALAVVAALFWTVLLVLPLLILVGIIAFFVFRPHITRLGPRRF